MSKRLLLALLTTSGLAAATPVFGQPASPADSTQDSSTASASNTGGIETVIVSARKRSEDAQTVPIAITALNQSDLDELHIQTIQDLGSVAPSVDIEPSTFRQDTLNVTIRGQRNFDSSGQGGNPGLSFDTASAVYVDGVYYARAVGLGGSLFDMSSVDVLKGPQGTLVGRNTTGGAVLLETNAPTSEFGGYVKLLGGDYNQYTAQGAVNIPLSDTLFFRVALSDQGNKGYVHNFFTDPASRFTNSQPAEGTQKLAGRFSLKWVPDDSFSLLIRADISGEHDTGSTYHDLGYFVGTTPATGNKPSVCNIPGACVGFTDLLGHQVAPYYTTVTAAGASGVNPAPAAYNSLINSVMREQTEGFWSTEQTLSNGDTGHYHTFSAVADKTIDDIDVKLLGAYRFFDSFGSSNSRGQSFDTANFSYGMPNYQSWESELTVNGKAFENKLQWTTGFFFFEENSPRDGGNEYLFLPSAGSAPAPVAGKQLTVTNWNNNGERNTSYAGYAQATYSITDDTRLTAGVRYTIDQRAAFIDTTTIRTPATAATSAAVVNGVFNPTGFTYQGITYSNQTDICAITSLSGVSLPLPQCGMTVSKTFERPTWTVAVDHDLFDKTLVYFTSRSGYRSGGINTQAVNPAYTVAAPESVIDFELGIKSDWTLWDMPLRANIDAYETQYKNIQTAMTLPNITLATGPGGVGACTQAVFSAGQCLGTQNANVTFNGRSARVNGFEWDITVLPVPQLTLNWTGSYLDARYTNFTVNPPPDYLLPNGTTDLSGTPFPLPAWHTNIIANYAFGLHQIGDVSVGDLVLSAHYAWQSRYLADLQGYNPSQRTSAYGMLNMRLALEDIAHAGADLAVFVNNVTNQPACVPEYVGVLNSAPNATFGIAGTSGVLQCIPLAPRMAGVTLGYKF